MPNKVVIVSVFFFFHFIVFFFEKIGENPVNNRIRYESVDNDLC